MTNPNPDASGAPPPGRCSCSCGRVSFDIVGTPLFRILCHCTICQRYSGEPFADVVVYRAASVVTPPDDTVSFQTYKPPPNVQRGSCVECGDPVIETFTAPLFPALTMVPTAMHDDGADMPEPVAHMFYDKRVEDVHDDLPKHSGMLASQLTFGRHLLFPRPKNEGGG